MLGAALRKPEGTATAEPEDDLDGTAPGAELGEQDGEPDCKEPGAALGALDVDADLSWRALEAVFREPGGKLEGEVRGLALRETDCSFNGEALGAALGEPHGDRDGKVLGAALKKTEETSPAEPKYDLDGTARDGKFLETALRKPG